MPRPTAQDVHINAPMSNISIAYRNNDYIYPEIFPQVPVNKKSDLYFIFDPGSFYRQRSQPRAPATRAQTSDYGLVTACYLCINDTAAALVADEVVDNADVPLRPLVTATRFVTDGLELGEEIRVAAKITACTNWGAASVPGIVWSSDNSDPFADIQTSMDAVVKKIGRLPNVGVTSWPVWRRLQNHPNFLERLKYTRPGGTLTPADIENWFGLEKFVVGKSIYEAAQEGATSNKQFIWGNVFWTGYVSQSPALEEPSAGYVFRWGNRSVSTYRMQLEHANFVEATWFVAEHVTASESGAGMYGTL